MRRREVPGPVHGTRRRRAEVLLSLEQFAAGRKAIARRCRVCVLFDADGALAAECAAARKKFEPTSYATLAEYLGAQDPRITRHTVQDHFRHARAEVR